MENVEAFAVEGEVPGQRLVQHDADGVPVTGRRHRLPRGLLRRHVGDRAKQVDAQMALIAIQFRRQTKIEQHDAPLGRDEDVARFDVAMQLAGFVQEVDSGGQLRQRVAQAGQLVGSQRRPLLAPRNNERGIVEPRRQIRAKFRLAVDMVEEGDALDDLHRKEPLQAVAGQLVKADEIGVVQPRETAKFLLEAQAASAHPRLAWS